MHLCVISFKECWQDADGRWLTDGGFPLQMAAIGSLFAQLTMLLVQVAPRAGGMPLPAHARVVPMRQPAGADGRRKLSVLLRLPAYLSQMAGQVAKADVVHTPLPGDLALLGMITALVLRKRLIARYGSSWYSTKQTTLMNRVTRGIMRLFAGGNNVMLATGESSGEPAPRMRWIFVSAISRHELATVRPDLDRLPQELPRLAYVGRLSPEKGVQLLIEALALLRADPSVAGRLRPISLIGDGPQRAELLALAEHRGVADLFHFSGQLDRPALLAQLLAHDACVLPSLTESFGKARLDAMLCGCPVLTTTVGFGEEIVGAAGERGWAVAPGDAAALAAALRTLLTAPLGWPALRRRCRAYVEGRTLERWAEAIGQVCSETWSAALRNGKLSL